MRAHSGSWGQVRLFIPAQHLPFYTGKLQLENKSAPMGGGCLCADGKHMLSACVCNYPNRHPTLTPPYSCLSSLFCLAAPPLATRGGVVGVAYPSHTFCLCLMRLCPWGPCKLPRSQRSPLWLTKRRDSAVGVSSQALLRGRQALESSWRKHREWIRNVMALTHVCKLCIISLTKILQNYIWQLE